MIGEYIKYLEKGELVASVAIIELITDGGFVKF